MGSPPPAALPLAAADSDAAGADASEDAAGAELLPVLLQAATRMIALANAEDVARHDYSSDPLRSPGSDERTWRSTSPPTIVPAETLAVAKLSRTAPDLTRPHKVAIR